jgi:XRE family transcriptional regulator, regulator of sulfur utilization
MLPSRCRGGAAARSGLDARARQGYQYIMMIDHVDIVKGVPPPALAGRRHRPTEKLGAIVAERLQRLINRKGRTYEKIADLSGLEVAELRRIGRGEDTPTIAHLWRIANALGVPFGSLIAAKESSGLLVMRKIEAEPVRSGDGGFVSRALYPYDSQRPVEFYHVTIAPSHIERSEAHPPGTKETLVVAKGSIEVVVGREPPLQLDEGDAVDFLADVPHSYRNLAVVPAAIYLVMSYETPGGADGEA